MHQNWYEHVNSDPSDDDLGYERQRLDVSNDPIEERTRFYGDADPSVHIEADVDDVVRDVTDAAEIDRVLNRIT